MTREEFRDQMWKAVPGIRKIILGRRRVDRMVDVAVERTPASLLRRVAKDSDEMAVVMSTWRGDIKKHYSLKHGDDAIQFGPLFWIIASAVIQYIVTKILEWWFERRECRELIESWNTEGTT